MGTYDNIGYEIAKAAYDLWEKGGCRPGKDLENWLEAERIVMTRSAEKSQPKEKPKKAAPYEKNAGCTEKGFPQRDGKGGPGEKGGSQEDHEKSRIQKRGKEDKVISTKGRRPAVGPPFSCRCPLLRQDLCLFQDRPCRLLLLIGRVAILSQNALDQHAQLSADVLTQGPVNGDVGA